MEFTTDFWGVRTMALDLMREHEFNPDKKEFLLRVRDHLKSLARTEKETASLACILPSFETLPHQPDGNCRELVRVSDADIGRFFALSASDLSDQEISWQHSLFERLRQKNDQANRRRARRQRQMAKGGSPL